VIAELYAEFAHIFPYTTIRIIPFKVNTGLDNMCIDACLAECAPQIDKPIIRFYGWNPSCLSLGRHQTSTDVDIDALIGGGYDIVRRPTGGSAIFHSQELTYSFIVPGKNLDHSGLYGFFHIMLQHTLRRLGITVSLEHRQRSYRLNNGADSFACFNRSAFSELQYEGKKVVGSAQKILNNSLLQHGSLLLGNAHLKIVDFLKLDQPSQELYRKRLQNKATDLRSICGHDTDEHDIVDLFIEELTTHLGLKITFEPVSEEEKNVSLKYRSEFSVTSCI
jgi:lipoate-protein ligase A